jgi:hypothetical protein
VSCVDYIDKSAAGAGSGPITKVACTDGLPKYVIQKQSVLVIVYTGRIQLQMH